MLSWQCSRVVVTRQARWRAEEVFPEPSSMATFGRGGAAQGRVNQTLDGKLRNGGRAGLMAALARWVTACGGLAALAAALTTV
jgi:hypothetical protein